MWLSFVIFIASILVVGSVWEIVRWVLNTSTKAKQLERDVALLTEYRNFQEKNNQQTMENFRQIAKKLSSIKIDIDSVRSDVNKKINNVKHQKNKFSVSRSASAPDRVKISHLPKKRAKPTVKKDVTD